MSESVLIIVSLSIVTLLGLLFCFSGYRLARVLLSALAIFAGAAAALALTANLELEPLVKTGIVVVSGLALMVITWMLYPVAMFMSGAALGASLPYFITGAFNISFGEYYAVAIIALALICGAITVVYRKTIFRAITAYNGSYISIVGGLMLYNAFTLRPDTLEQAFNTSASMLDANSMLFFAAIIILAASGFLIQQTHSSKPQLGIKQPRRRATRPPSSRSPRTTGRTS
ncbi:MAG: DUF4203 domain-containing protein [Christensenellales bacterium]